MIDANEPKFRSFDSTSRSNLNPESRSFQCKFHFSLSAMMMNQCGFFFFFFFFFRFKVLEKKGREEKQRHTNCIFRENCTKAREKKKKKILKKKRKKKEKKEERKSIVIDILVCACESRRRLRIGVSSLSYFRGLRESVDQNLEEFTGQFTPPLNTVFCRKKNKEKIQLLPFYNYM